MINKKKLNKEELKKVSGGDSHESLEHFNFMFGKAFHVEVRTHNYIFHQCTTAAKILHRGYIHDSRGYTPVYYLVCEDNDYTGWYDEDYLQDTTYTHWEKINENVTPVTILD